MELQAKNNRAPMIACDTPILATSYPGGAAAIIFALISLISAILGLPCLLFASASLLFSSRTRASSISGAISFFSFALCLVATFLTFALEAADNYRQYHNRQDLISTANDYLPFWAIEFIMLLFSGLIALKSRAVFFKSSGNSK